MAFYDTEGNYLNHMRAGALPDMVTFTHNGKYVLSAIGEPLLAVGNEVSGTTTIYRINSK